ISRAATLAPERFPIEGGYAIYPREPSGGTWIAANSFGVTLALLNWYSVPATAPKSRSRGEVIPRLIAEEDSGSVHDALTKLPFETFAESPCKAFEVWPDFRSTV